MRSRKQQRIPRRDREKRKRPRPKLNSLDRLFWTALHQCWSRWTEFLVLVKPGTVIGSPRLRHRLRVPSCRRPVRSAPAPGPCAIPTAPWPRLCVPPPPACPAHTPRCPIRTVRAAACRWWCVGRPARRTGTAVLPQDLGDFGVADRMVSRRQFRRKRAGALAGPAQRRLRGALPSTLPHGSIRLEKRRILSSRRLSDHLLVLGKQKAKQAPWPPVSTHIFPP